jgi:hypothetical protein
MSNIDWNLVNSLLGAIHGAASAGPKYTNIVARAEAELNAHMMNNPEDAAPPAEAPVTAPPASLQAVSEPEPVSLPAESEPASPMATESVEPGPDATATTATDRRV